MISSRPKIIDHKVIWMGGKQVVVDVYESVKPVTEWSIEQKWEDIEENIDVNYKDLIDIFKELANEN